MFMFYFVGVGSITMPAAGAGTVTINALVSPGGSGRFSAVNRVTAVTISEGAAAPIADPTFSPTPRPTNVGETNPPSAEPTLTPTKAPTKAPVVGPFIGNLLIYMFIHEITYYCLQLFSISVCIIG